MAPSGPSGDNSTTSFDMNAIKEKICREKEEQTKKYGRHQTWEDEFEMERKRTNNETAKGYQGRWGGEAAEVTLF